MAKQRRLPRTITKIYPSIHSAPRTFLKEYKEAQETGRSSFTWENATFMIDVSGPHMRLPRGTCRKTLPAVFKGMLEVTTIIIEVAQAHSTTLPSLGWYEGSRHGYIPSVSVRVSPSEPIKVMASGADLLSLTRFFREVMANNYPPDYQPKGDERLI